jgi:hypothetical protein
VKGRQVSSFILFFLVASASLAARPASTQTLTAEQAKDHIGETAKVCGQVVSPHYAYKTNGHPTFLNFDRPYPHQVFTAVIWGTDRPKFGQPEKQYRNKHICVTGRIRLYRDRPEIVLHSPKQITEK